MSERSFLLPPPFLFICDLLLFLLLRSLLYIFLFMLFLLDFNNNKKKSQIQMFHVCLLHWSTSLAHFGDCTHLMKTSCYQRWQPNVKLACITGLSTGKKKNESIHLYLFSIKPKWRCFFIFL